MQEIRDFDRAPQASPEGYTRAVSSESDEPRWASTEEVMEAAGTSKATIFRWAKLGVLPQPEVIYARGRFARWPLHAPAQAKWVDQKLRAGWTFGEIAAALGRGDFPVTSSIEEG